MRALFVFCLACLFLQQPRAQNSAADYPVRAFSINAPTRLNLDSFLVFIEKDLATRGINTLVLMVDYNYQYTSHPELVMENALSSDDVAKIVKTCRYNNINIIPQINLLGHQSWAGKLMKLLEKYPEFDETPWIKMPEQYKWPNADSLYCKSYCPLHPGVHDVVFDLVDEICDVFGAKAFHAGMDEVFYIGMDKCPRCSGKNKAELFAGEVNRIRNHLAEKNRTLYIWGDRLIDGYTTGVGGWEGSYNATYPAIDLINKDVVICDWHYERADKTAPYFAAKGFRVITSTWNRPAVAVEQEKDMRKFYAESSPEMKARFLGVMQTVWSPVTGFFKDYYNTQTDSVRANRSNGMAFRASFPTRPQKFITDSLKTYPIVAYVPCRSPEAIRNINFSAITHIHFAFLNPDSTGNFTYNPCLDSLVKMAHARGVRVLASIGGGSAPEYYAELLKDTKRPALIAKLAELAVAYDVDGIDVDLEGSRIDEHYENFIDELVTALRPMNKLVTAAIATVYKDQFTDKALRQFDYITLMSYDKTGPWRPNDAGPHSPYDMAVEDLRYWSGERKLPKDKLYLGLPFYGYSFGPNGAGSMNFHEIVTRFPGAEKKDQLKLPDGSVLYYNGIPTIRKKVQLAKQNAGGIMFWQLFGDTTGEKSLLQTIHNEAYRKDKTGKAQNPKGKGKND